MSPHDTIAEAVAAAFALTPEALHRSFASNRPSLAKAVYVYMLVLYLPRPERFPARGGKTRRAGARDGTCKPVARYLGLHPSGVRYHLHRVENRRETDAELEQKLARIEGELDAALLLK